MKRPYKAEKSNERTWFDELSMKEVVRSAGAGKIIILPVGSVEEHGDHLPLCTDTLQPEYVARQVAEKTGCLIAPTIKYGVCNSTRNFPGTISISFESLRGITHDVLEEFVRNGFNRLLVLSGHAGNTHMAALRIAAQEVLQNHINDNSGKKVRIMVLSDYDFAYELKGKYFSRDDGHAGSIETSRVKAIKPELVKARGAKSSPEFPRFEVLVDSERVFPSGVIGDPTVATARKGKEINEYIVKEVIKLVEELKK
jgi:creatinine amidohydrolase